jgi:hypothetical protein
VAFDRETPANVESNVQVATLSQSEFPTAAVIPAALRTDPSPSLRAKRRADSGHVNDHIDQHPVIEAVSDAPKVSAPHDIPNDNGSSPVDILTVGANEMVVPGEALLVVRTTQRVGPNAWVSSVSMWRVTWVNIEQDEKGTAPIPKKT